MFLSEIIAVARLLKIVDLVRRVLRLPEPRP